MSAFCLIVEEKYDNIWSEYSKERILKHCEYTYDNEAECMEHFNYACKEYEDKVGTKTIKMNKANGWYRNYGERETKMIKYAKNGSIIVTICSKDEKYWYTLSFLKNEN